MSIAFDAKSQLTTSNSSADGSWTHTPVGTPAGVIVMITQGENVGDQVVGVTYGGTAMTRVNTASEAGGGDPTRSYLYFLGASVPSGAQTVAVDINNTYNYAATAVTVTATSGSTEVDVSNQGNGTSSNPTHTLNYTDGLDDWIALICMADGAGTVAGASINTGTSLYENDLGQQVGMFSYIEGTEGTSQSFATTANNASWAWCGVVVKEVVSGDHTVAVNQITETDTAQAFTVVKNALTASVGQNTETDTAQSVTPIKTIIQNVNQIVETDTAQAFTAVNNALTATVGQTTETDLAQTFTSVSSPLTVAVGQTTETDTAQPIAVQGPITAAVGQTTETDTAFSITPIKTIVAAVGQVVETDTAQAFTSVNQALSVSLGLAEETDLAQAINPSGPKVRPVNQVTETDVAQSITPVKTIVAAVGQVLETDTAQTVAAVKAAITVVVGQTFETDLAFSISFPHFVDVGLAVETDVAQSIVPALVLFVPEDLASMDGTDTAASGMVGSYAPSSAMQSSEQTSGLSSLGDRSAGGIHGV